MIRLTNLDRMYDDLYYSLYNVHANILDDGQAMMGRYTLQLEEAIASRSGAKHCAVVGSGSDALMYGLRASGVSSVSVPAQTFIATQNSCLRSDIDITWKDVDENGCIAWDQVTDTHAIWVGLFGNDTKIPSGITVFEDGAQHFGLYLKGEFASYSFDPTKSLPNFGNGGAVVSNNKELIDDVKKLRRHGQVGDNVGGNSIMSERDCAELLVKLEHFDEWTAWRRELASFYMKRLAKYVNVVTNMNGMVSKFVISTPEKEKLKQYLSDSDIQTKDAYAKSLANMPQATLNCSEFLQIPCDSYTTLEEAALVVEAIKTFFQPSPLKT